MAYDLGDFILIGDEGVILIPGVGFGEGGFGEGPFGGETSVIISGATTEWTNIETP